MKKPKMTLESILSEYTDRIAEEARWAQFKDDMRLLMYGNDYTADQLIDIGFDEALVHTAAREIAKEIEIEDTVEAQPTYSDVYHYGKTESMREIAVRLADEKGWTRDELIAFGLLWDDEYIENGKVMNANPIPAEGIVVNKK